MAPIVDPTSYQELNGALLTNEPQANFDLTRVDESVQSAQNTVLAELTKKQLEIISAELDNRESSMKGMFVYGGRVLFLTIMC